MVKAPLEYPWSSYRYYVGRDKKPKWLTTEFVLGDFGGERRGLENTGNMWSEGKTRNSIIPLKK
jgi:hypothetical protein